MELNFKKDSIVSVTDVVQKFGSIRTKVKEGNDMIVFKNNKPDLAIIDIEEYESLLNMVNELEDIKIANMIRERESQYEYDPCGLDEILAMCDV